MEIINRYQQLKKADQALARMEACLILDFDQAKDLSTHLNTARQAVKKQLEDMNQDLELLEDACTLITHELKDVQTGLPEIEQLLATAKNTIQLLKNI